MYFHKGKRRQYKKNSIPYNYTQFFIIFALNFRKSESSGIDTTQR